jgi:hypothetical protein
VIVSFGVGWRYPLYAHPMKEDVKRKSFSPPLWEMRKW